MQLGVAGSANDEALLTAGTLNQNKVGNGPKKRVILAGKVFDPFEEKFIYNQAITIDLDRGTILDIDSSSTAWDSRSACSQDNQDVEFRSPSSPLHNNVADTEVIDLRHLTLLPGLVDAHVHLFLHSYAETSWNDQLTKESLAERTLRASVHARQTLQAGYTTVRDLGTEGAEDADIALRKCMAFTANGALPLITGPRYYCVTRAIVATGSYGPKSSLYPSQNNIEGVIGAVSADGIDECIRAVRRQIGAGADWIKIYGDYRFRSRMADVSDDIPSRALNNFNEAELKAMIDTAHSLGVKVAVHASTPEVLDRLLDLGPDSIEHGGSFFNGPRGPDLIEKWVNCAHKPTWVPTLSVYYFMSQQANATLQTAETWEGVREGFEKVLKHGRVLGHGNGGQATPGIPIACGGDTGAFPHGENALELSLMRRLGAPWSKVLSWATLGGWKCVRGMEWEGDEGQGRLDAVGDSPATMARNKHSSGKFALERKVPFGAIRKGWTADIVGVEGTLDGNAEEFEKSLVDGMRFVMKGGQVHRINGSELAKAM